MDRLEAANDTGDEQPREGEDVGHPRGGLEKLRMLQTPACQPVSMEMSKDRSGNTAD